MELRDYVRVALRWWFVILALLIAGGGAGYAIAKLTPPTYQGTSSIYVNVANAATAQELSQGSNVIQNLMPTYTALATSSEVLVPVVDELDLDVSSAALARQISAENPLNTLIIRISTRDASAARAVEIADAVSTSLGAAIERLTPSLSVPIENEGAPPTIVTVPVVSVSELASDPEPNSAVAPVTLYYVAAGAMGGLAVGVILALVFDRIRHRRTSGNSAET